VTTLAQLVDATLVNLQGYTLDQDQVTYLAVAAAVDDTTLKVGDATEVSRGLIEVGDELVWATSVDAATGTVTLAPQGRGWRSTVPVAHAYGTTVTNSPRFPRSVVANAVNQAITAVFPDLFAVKAYEFTYTPAVYAYELPADAAGVAAVEWQTIGPDRTWARVRRYRYVPDSDPDAFASGRSLELAEYIDPGRTVRVTYLARPQQLATADTQFSTSGLPDSASDVAVFGACYRLVGWQEPPRLQTQSIEGTLRSQVVPAGAATGAGRYFYALYQERLERERRALLASYPTTTHFIR